MNEAQYLKRWKRENAKRSTRYVAVGGFELLVDKDVFSPDPELTYSTLYLINNLPDLAGKSVLDIGTGTGVLAIFAAKKGAKHVTAVDNNSVAVRNAKANISKYDLEDTISVIESDIFENVIGKYDVIVANLPIWDSAWCEQGKSVNLLYDRFFGEIKSHMKPGGKVLFSYASFGDMEVILKGMRESGLKFNKTEEERFGVEWYLFESL